MTIALFIVTSLACVICFVEWAAARTDFQHHLFKTLTLLAAILALVTGIAVGVSGQGLTLVGCAVGCLAIFAGYGIFRAVTRKG